jgi:hypothetical protein
MNGENKFKNSAIYSYLVVIVVRSMWDKLEGCFKHAIKNIYIISEVIIQIQNLPNAFYRTTTLSVEWMT